MGIKSFDVDALLKRQEELKKGNVENTPLDIDNIIKLAKQTKKVYRHGNIAVDSSMTLEEHIVLNNIIKLNSENIYDTYNEKKEILKRVTQKGGNTDDNDNYWNLMLDIYAREIFVRMPELRGDFSHEDLKRVQRSLSDENSVLNKSFKDRDVYLESVNVCLAQKERALENSCKQQNPEAFSYLDEYEKKMNETMAKFSPLNLRTIRSSEVYDSYIFFKSVGHKIKVMKQCGGIGNLMDENHEYTPLGKQVRNVIDNENFDMFNYVEYLKQDTAYQKFAEECKADGLSLGQTVSLYTLDYGKKINEALINEDNKLRQSAETQQTEAKEAVVQPAETQQTEAKEAIVQSVEMQKTEQKKTDKSTDNDTKAYRDFGEILKDKSLSEEEQMWYLDRLIEEEKQEVAMKGTANKVVELRGLGKEKNGPTIKRDLPSNMIKKIIENKSKQSQS